MVKFKKIPLAIDFIKNRVEDIGIASRACQRILVTGGARM